MLVLNTSPRLFARRGKDSMILRSKFETRLTMPLERRNILFVNIRGNQLDLRPGSALSLGC